MSRYVSSLENTGCTTQQCSRADREQEVFVLNVPSNKPKHFLIVHQGLLPVASRNEKNIENSCFRNAHIR